MRYLVCQDIHLKGINSENRIGNYHADIMKKVKEIIAVAKKEKVDAILCGGDLFDIPIVSNLIVDELVDSIEEGKIRWYITPGNHDEIGHYWENSKGTSLAHIFRRSKCIKYLETIDLTDTNENLYIKGFEYYHNIELDIRKNGLFSSKKCPKKAYKIAIVHALITKKPLPYKESHIMIDEIKTNFNIIFVAHNHQRWGIIEQNGVKFVNLGCIGRRKIDEIHQMPEIAIFDTETKEIDIRILKSAKLGEQVFNIAEVEKTKQYRSDVDNFINSLSEEKFEELDLLEIIEHIAKKSKIKKEIKDEVIRRIE